MKKTAELAITLLLLMTSAFIGAMVIKATRDYTLLEKVMCIPVGAAMFFIMAVIEGIVKKRILRS